ncbi:MAG: hypothetical protein HWN65_20765 [Candidatus Helarchaeota archaeon]|nr:hypothetical protein [Candidatus Helarchaeota archaeon]
MNISEKEKIKRVEILAGLEKKVVRRLVSGKAEEAIEELKDIIDEYRRLNLHHKAEILQITLNEFMAEFRPEIIGKEEPPQPEEQKIVQVLEARSKKAIRRFIQGKTDAAVEELLNIIEEFRNLKMEERAKTIEDWMYEFLGKKLEEEERDRPLSERLETDPELEEQLLSYRTQKIIKRFIKGDHRKAVEEFTQIVNEYKRLGKLEIVEMLEVWFNLFITKMYLIKPQAPQPQAPGPQPPRPPLPSSPALPPQVPQPPSIVKSPARDTEDANAEQRYKNKISRIKNLLKKFERSL